MAIAFVQSRSVADVTLAYSVNVTSGNLLIVAAGSKDNAGGVTFAVSDTRGNLWNPVALVDANPIGGGRGQIFWAISKDSGPCTVSLVTTSTTPQLLIHEFSGATFLDTQSSATGSGVSTDSGPATTSVSSELLFGFNENRPSVNPATLTEGAGWTLAEKILAGGLASLTEWQIVAAIGTFDATTSLTLVGKGATNFWTEQIVTFSPTAPVSSGAYQIGCRHNRTFVSPGMSR